MLYTPDTGGKRVYCGPFAIAAVTGASIEKIYKMVRRRRREGDLSRGRVLNRDSSTKDRTGRLLPIKGMYYNWEVFAILKRLGFKPIESKPFAGTLRAFCEDRGHMGPFIVNVTSHYVVVDHGVICDNGTGHPIPINEYRKLGRRVVKFWRFK